MNYVVAPHDLWFGSDANTNCEVIYGLHLDVILMGMKLVYRCLTDGRRDGLPFLGTGYPEREVGFILFSMKSLMCGILFLHLSASLGCFFSSDSLFEKRIGQVTMDLII